MNTQAITVNTTQFTTQFHDGERTMTNAKSKQKYLENLLKILKIHIAQGMTAVFSPQRGIEDSLWHLTALCHCAVSLVTVIKWRLVGVLSVLHIHHSVSSFAFNWGGCYCALGASDILWPRLCCKSSSLQEALFPADTLTSQAPDSPFCSINQIIFMTAVTR